jgi:hypothetical protein
MIEASLKSRQITNPPFIAKSLSVFFSRTRYTRPTSPFPSILIFKKLDGPTSTCNSPLCLRKSMLAEKLYNVPAEL